MSRLRTGEWLAGSPAAIALLVLLFLPWFDGRIGWTSLGWLMIALLVLCIAGAAWIAARRRSTACSPGSCPRSSITHDGGARCSLVILVLPGARVRRPATRRPPPMLGILATAAIIAGAGVALADERTDAPESAFTPPAPRPVPPAT